MGVAPLAPSGNRPHPANDRTAPYNVEVCSKAPMKLSATSDREPTPTAFAHW